MFHAAAARHGPHPVLDAAARSTAALTAATGPISTTTGSPAPRTRSAPPPARPSPSQRRHGSPYDEHPVADVTRGQDKIWQAVDAIVTTGLWDTTVFLLS